MAAEEARTGSDGPAVEQHDEVRVGDWEIHIRRSSDGFTVQFTTDPSRQKAVDEAVEAFREFRRKARRAGLTPVALLRALVREQVRGLVREEDED